METPKKPKQKLQVLTESLNPPPSMRKTGSFNPANADRPASQPKVTPKTPSNGKK